MGERLGIGAAMEVLGWLAADPERATVLMAAAQSEWDRIETSIHALPGLDVHHQSAADAARRLLGEEAFEHAWLLGASLDQDAPIGLCLDDRTRRPGRLEATTRRNDVLTRRERQMAELVHQGLTNKDIADTLVISRRTAEAHVQNILAKLGFTSRTQLAVWVGESSSPEEL